MYPTIMKNRYAASLANVDVQSFYSLRFLYNYLLYNSAKAVMLQWLISSLATGQQRISELQVTGLPNKGRVVGLGDQSDH